MAAFDRAASPLCGVSKVCMAPRPPLVALKNVRLQDGQRPLFETRERNYIKIASEELKRGLIELVADEEQTGPTKLEV